MCDFHHIPVLLNEVIKALSPMEGESALDLTLGGGGHALAIAKAIGSSGQMMVIDRDPDALRAGLSNIANAGPEIHSVLASFADLASLLGKSSTPRTFDLVLADLGVSSHQLDQAERGFSFQVSAPLDMRMSKAGQTAADLIESVEADELADILFYYGDIKESRRLSRAIIADFKAKKIQTTTDLADLCWRVLGKAKHSTTHPATRVFQALRIAVNDEFNAIKVMLETLPRFCRPGARIAIISFHSGEDRIVKNVFKTWENPCHCPKSLPECVCGKKPLGKIANKKAITATEEELRLNPRARSAKLRTFRFY